MKTKNKIVCIVLAVFLLVSSALVLFLPKAEFSESERRPYAKFPVLSAETVKNGSFMNNFESYCLDAFPFRDFFRSLNAVFSTGVFGQKDNNGLYLADGYIAAMEYPLNEQAIRYAASRFAFIYEKYLRDKGANVYLSVIPDKSYFLAEKSGHLSLDYEKLVATLREDTDFAEYLDIFPLLSIEDYYKTDTHWRQEQIVDVANALLAGMGTSGREDYTKNTLDHPFRGVYYGQSALPLPSEIIYYLTSGTLENAVVRDEQNGKDIPVYDLEKGVGRDPYEMFLSGSLSLITLENPNAKTDRELVIFRDSFGSSIAPLLLEGYSKVTLVDIRYIHPAIICPRLNFSNTDVLFLYSTLVLNNSETIK